MIAGSFGVSAGLEQSGGAAAIANLIISIGKNAGGGNFTIAAVYVATTLLSQIIANNSAAALMFPIAATISKNDNVDVSGEVVSAAAAASVGNGARRGMSTSADTARALIVLDPCCPCCPTDLPTVLRDHAGCKLCLHEQLRLPGVDQAPPAGATCRALLLHNQSGPAIASLLPPAALLYPVPSPLSSPATAPTATSAADQPDVTGCWRPLLHGLH